MYLSDKTVFSRAIFIDSYIEDIKKSVYEFDPTELSLVGFSFTKGKDKPPITLTEMRKRYILKEEKVRGKDKVTILKHKKSNAFKFIGMIDKPYKFYSFDVDVVKESLISETPLDVILQVAEYEMKPRNRMSGLSDRGLYWVVNIINCRRYLDDIFMKAKDLVDIGIKDDEVNQ